MADFFWTPTELAFAVPGGVVLGALIAVLGVWRSNAVASRNIAKTIASAERQQKETLFSAERQQAATLQASREAQERSIESDRQLALESRLWAERLRIYIELIQTIDFIREPKVSAFMKGRDPAYIPVIREKVDTVVRKAHKEFLVIAVMASETVSTAAGELNKAFGSVAQTLVQIDEGRTVDGATIDELIARLKQLERIGTLCTAALAFDLRSTKADKMTWEMMNTSD